MFKCHSGIFVLCIYFKLCCTSSLVSSEFCGCLVPRSLQDLVSLPHSHLAFAFAWPRYPRNGDQKRGKNNLFVLTSGSLTFNDV